MKGICRVHDPEDVVPGRICGRPLPCRDHAKSAPPDRIVVGWCPYGHIACAVLPAESRQIGARCHQCPSSAGRVPIHRVRYQLATRRPSK